MKHTSLLLLLLCLTGCLATRPVESVSVASGVELVLQLPRQEISRTQTVVASYKGQQHLLLIQTEASPTRLVMAGLTPTGSRLFSVEFDGQTVQSWRSPLFNAPFDGRYLIADFELAQFPLEQLRPALSGPVQLRELQQDGVLRRELADLAGQSLIRIDYRGSSMNYCHLQRDYCLQIETLPGN